MTSNFLDFWISLLDAPRGGGTVEPDGAAASGTSAVSYFFIYYILLRVICCIFIIHSSRVRSTLIDISVPIVLMCRIHVASFYSCGCVLSRNGDIAKQQKIRASARSLCTVGGEFVHIMIDTLRSRPFCSF